MSETRSIHCDGAGCAKKRAPGDEWFSVQIKVERDPFNPLATRRDQVGVRSVDLCPACAMSFTRGIKMMLRMPEGEDDFGSVGGRKC